MLPVVGHSLKHSLVHSTSRKDDNQQQQTSRRTRRPHLTPFQWNVQQWVKRVVGIKTLEGSFKLKRIDTDTYTCTDTLERLVRELRHAEKFLNHFRQKWNVVSPPAHEKPGRASHSLNQERAGRHRCNPPCRRHARHQNDPNIWNHRNYGSFYRPCFGSTAMSIKNLACERKVLFVHVKESSVTDHTRIQVRLSIESINGSSIGANSCRKISYWSVVREIAHIFPEKIRIGN